MPVKKEDKDIIKCGHESVFLKEHIAVIVKWFPSHLKLSLDDSDNCCICFNTLNKIQTMIELNCGHLIRGSCLEKHITNTPYKNNLKRDVVHSTGGCTVDETGDDKHTVETLDGQVVTIKNNKISRMQASCLGHGNGLSQGWINMST